MCTSDSSYLAISTSLKYAFTKILRDLQFRKCSGKIFHARLPNTCMANSPNFVLVSLIMRSPLVFARVQHELMVYH